MVNGISEVDGVVRALQETRSRCVERIAGLEDLGHELRTPLNGIVATIDLLAATALDAEQTELVSTLTQSAERLIAAVDQVADSAGLAQHLSATLADAQFAITEVGSTTEQGPTPAARPSAVLSAPSPPATPAIAAPHVEAPADDDDGQLRVLVAEDNTTNQLVVRSLLERMGHACRVVENGRLAVDAVQEQAFDVILMDCMMPVLDGFGATREIRALEASCADIPILALTANAMKGDRERCLEAGMTEYMAKPVRLDILTDMLCRFAPRRAS